jgi:uroporphyrinogen decarboxylase
MDYVEYAYKMAGGKLQLYSEQEKRAITFSVDERMIPQFEEKVIEEKENSRIVQDWKGNICEIGKEFTVEYLRNAIDFVTRRWIKCPVENRSDWIDMKKRYDAGTFERLPADAEKRAELLKNRDYVVTFDFSGPFWQLREWLGFERLCELFYDDPAWIEEMIEFWEDYIASLLKRAFTVFVPDVVLISEDMAYKNFSMVSPAMTRQYLLPVWRKWGELIRGAGVPIYMIDSDGYIGELIPIWIEAGLNACTPIEVAAGNDIAIFRKQFGKNMAFFGGVDKRAMSKGGKVIEAEIERLLPVIKSGGYIPSCDHGVPSDVSWANYVYYTRLLAQATGWL